MAKQLFDLDTINKKAAQLDALLNSMHGEGFHGFNVLKDDLKDSLIWLAADLACDIKRAAEAEASHG